MSIDERTYRKELINRKSKISDRDVFTSRPFFSLLERLNNHLIKNKNKVKLNFLWDKNEPRIAWTDGKTIYVNGINEISSSMPNRELMALSYIGVDAHEVGHRLYSDFDELRKYMENLSVAQKFYPGNPQPMCRKDQDALDEMIFYLKDADSAIITSAVIAEVAGNINNAIEDAWMEVKMCDKFRGSVKRGIALNSFRMMEMAPSLNNMINGSLAPFDIMFNLVLQYVRSGQINNWENLSNVYTEFLYEISDMLDEVVVEDSIKKRFETTNLIIVMMWSWIKDEVEKIKKLPQMPRQSSQKQNESDQSQENSSPKGKSKDDGSSEESGTEGQNNASENKSSEEANNSASENRQSRENESQSSGGKSDGTGKENGTEGQNNASQGNQSSGETKDSASDNQSSEEHIEKRQNVPLSDEEQNKLNEFAERIEPKNVNETPQNTGKPLLKEKSNSNNDSRKNRKEFRKNIAESIENSVKEEGGRFTTEGREAEFLDNLQENHVEEIAEANLGNQLSSIINDMAKESVEIEEERKLKKSLESSLTAADLTRLHNVPRSICRIIDVPGSYIAEFNRIYPAISKASKKLQHEMEEILKKQDGYAERNLFIGKGIDHGSLYRQDRRIFNKKHNPGDGLELAAAVIVDQSGSMRSRNRLEYAKLAALTVYDFCSALNIPVAVYGHNVRGEVNLHVYADFDSVDGKDKYRIMGMAPSGCNRDGLAYRYVGNRLMQRPEQYKLIILISDGQPSDLGYGGEVARDDLYSAKTMLEKHDIYTFAAAIGDDCDVIRNIYGNGFLNISDLSKLPIQMVRLVQQFIKI